MWIESLITGVMSGGATGLLGIVLQQWGAAKQREQDIEVLRLQQSQALALRQLDIDNQVKLANIEAASAERLADIQAMARADEAASADYQASMAADRATYLSPQAQETSRLARWLMAGVDALRGIIRPGATIYSLVLLTILMLWVRDMYVRSLLVLSADQTQALAKEVIGTVTYLATTTTVWWFGIRGTARK